MLRYLYWRWWGYRKYFKNVNGISRCGQLCQDSLIRRALKVGEAVTERRKTLIARKRALKRQEDDVLKSVIVENDEYHAIKRRIFIQSLVVIVLVLAEFGLNYFTTFIIFGSDNAGLFWAAIRWAVAITITAIAVVATERFLEEALPKEKYKSKEPAEKRNILIMTFWVLGLVFSEAVIYFFGLVRAGDVEGGKAIAKSGLGADVAIGMIILSMVLPVIVGGIAWDINKYRGAYKNRKKYDKIQKEMEKVDSESDLLAERSNLQFQQEASAWWDTYNDFKTAKENKNVKDGIEEDLKKSDQWVFLKDFASFKAPAYKHFKQNLEEADPLGKLPASDFEVKKKPNKEAT